MPVGLEHPRPQVDVAVVPAGDRGQRLPLRDGVLQEPVVRIEQGPAERHEDGHLVDLPGTRGGDLVDLEHALRGARYPGQRDADLEVAPDPRAARVDRHLPELVPLRVADPGGERALEPGADTGHGDRIVHDVVQRRLPDGDRLVRGHGTLLSRTCATLRQVTAPQPSAARGFRQRAESGDRQAASTSRVSGSGPSMTTTTSMSVRACASALHTARGTSAGRRRVGMTTLTRGPSDTRNTFGAPAEPQGNRS